MSKNNKQRRDQAITAELDLGALRPTEIGSSSAPAVELSIQPPIPAPINPGKVERNRHLNNRGTWRQLVVRQLPAPYWRVGLGFRF